ncbi:kinase-like protein, partial [Mytilinidion resinicola]
MASLEGISWDYSSFQVSRTILSSVGGFSQPSNRKIDSLQSLLASVQQINLDTFEGSSFTYGPNPVGEGVSYKVWRCYHRRKNAVYAVKQIKLPSVKSDLQGFQRQIGCILRDVEVMHGHAKHPNILHLMGYGWDHQAGGALPFLVTDFAPGGTLRNFLKSHKISPEEKLILCQDVARGLHALHVSGIAHGDLKLDNVLAAAISDSSDSDNATEVPDVEGRRFGVVARLSDFGHSLRILYNEEAPEYLQRYGGTLVYNAPEVQQSRHSNSPTLNFRKCDMWSLGLLCWEVFRDGNPYFRCDLIHQRIDSARGTSGATSTNSDHTMSSTDLDDLVQTSSQFAELASAETKEILGTRLDTKQVSNLAEVFSR